jgi:hypothetical protein
MKSTFGGLTAGTCADQPPVEARERVGQISPILAVDQTEVTSRIAARHPNPHRERNTCRQTGSIRRKGGRQTCRAAFNSGFPDFFGVLSIQQANLAFELASQSWPAPHDIRRNKARSAIAHSVANVPTVP